MRISDQAHRDRPWRIHAVAAGFDLEDAWAMPELAGSPEEFDRLVRLFTRFDPAATTGATHLLWQARETLGKVLALDGPRGSEGAGALSPDEAALEAALDDDLVGTADEVRFDHLPFRPLYRTADEFAAHLSNRTVHGILHLGWVGEGRERHGELAVYVRPRGLLGRAYLALIRPFRHLVVYPAAERRFAAAWAAGSEAGRG